MIQIVGCGPGAEDQLTLAAKRAIDEADVLVGARRLLDLGEDRDVEKIAVTAHIDDVIKVIADHHADSRHVTVLVSGDPGIFSLARCVIQTFGITQCRVLPGISSVQTAFARLGMSWHDAEIVSAHHQLPDIDSAVVEAAPKLAILSGRDDVVPWLRQLVARRGPRVILYACENLTLEDEKITEVSEHDLAGKAFASRCVFLIIRKDAVS